MSIAESTTQMYQYGMPYDAFSHVDHWVFDLDNTLYSPEVRLFDQIERHMATFVMDQLNVDEKTAHHLRRHYWETHGTTLAGLMVEHDIDPDEFLALVHDIDLSGVTKNPNLRSKITALPGRKVIYTNGSREHGVNVSAACGLAGIFDAIYGIEDAEYSPKPNRYAFEKIFALDGVDPNTAAMFEDDPRNLSVPYQLGMKTVLVGSSEPMNHIHYQTRDLAGFLEMLVS